MKNLIIISASAFLFFVTSAFADTRLVGYEYRSSYDENGRYVSGMCMSAPMGPVGVWKTYRARAQTNEAIDYLRFHYISGPDSRMSWAVYQDDGDRPGATVAYGSDFISWNHGEGEYDIPADVSGYTEAGRYYWISVYADAEVSLYGGRCGAVVTYSESDGHKRGTGRHIGYTYPPPDGSEFTTIYNPGSYSWSVWSADGVQPPPPPPPPPPEYADIAITPRSLIFEELVVGNSETKYVTISNNGGSGLAIREIVLTGQAFRLVDPPSLPFTLDAGQSAVFGVNFSPAAWGQSHGTVTIQSNDSDEPAVEVSLEGIGLSVMILDTPIGAVMLTTAEGDITNASLVEDSTFPSVGKPEMTFPFGLIRLTISGVIVGGTADIEMTFPRNLPRSCEYWKYGATALNPNGGWYQIPVGSNDGDNVIFISITDGGLGDDDLQVNGVIVDAGGPALSSDPSLPVTSGGGGGGCFLLAVVNGE